MLVYCQRHDCHADRDVHSLQVKAEHELCVSETVNAKRQRDEFEVKCELWVLAFCPSVFDHLLVQCDLRCYLAVEAQLGEMKVIKNALVELETRHVSLVQQ